jgi:predicted RND superfamily exporter protein
MSSPDEFPAAPPEASQPLRKDRGAISRRVANWLIDHRLALFIVAVLLGVFSVERSRQLVFIRSIDTMFDRTDPALPPYRRLGRAFGSSEVVLAAYDAPDLLTPEGIATLGTVTARLERIPGIASATSLAGTPLGAGIIHVDTNPAARRLVSLLEGYAVSADHRTAAVVCVLEPAGKTAGVTRADAIDAVRAAVADLPGGTVAGEPVMLRDGFAMLERDGNLLGTSAGILAGAVLLVSFRSFRWLAVPLAVVLLGLWSTRGVLAVAGMKLTMVSTMLSAMITVVGIATVVHVIVEFRRQRELGLPPREALAEAIHLLFWPVIGAIATDMIGFGSLITSRVGPVHDFGIMTAIGAFLVLVSAALVVPQLALGGRFDTDPRRAWGEGLLDLGLDGLVRRIIRHPGRIMAGSTLVVAACMAGMGKLEVETDFIRNFRRSSPIVRSYEMIESRLGGAGVWDVLVPVSGSIDGATVARLNRLEERLRREVIIVGEDGVPAAALTKVLSVADVLAAVSPVPLDNAGSSALGNFVVGSAVTLLRQQLPQLDRSLIGRDPEDGSTWLRVMLRARERQPAEAKRKIVEEVRRIVAEELPAGPSGGGAEVTGFFVLLSKLVDRMLTDQWSTFLIAAMGIFLLLALSFRSLLLATVALVPNALPIFVVLGLMGWSGQRINMGTAMIAAVSMGLSVDSSIHWLVAFQRRLAGGHTLPAALDVAHQTAGRAMVFATLALVVGFLALTTSGFIPTVSFGALTCLTLLGGLAGNLVVLPVMLALLEPWLVTGCHPRGKPLQQPSTVD